MLLENILKVVLISAHYFIFKKDFTTNIRKSNLLTYLEFTEPNYNLNYVE